MTAEQRSEPTPEQEHWSLHQKSTGFFVHNGDFTIVELGFYQFRYGQAKEYGTQIVVDHGAAVERDRLVKELTPSIETKAAYMGEFSYRAEQIDEDGESQPVTYYVPWTTVKEIMAAILANASKP